VRLLLPGGGGYGDPKKRDRRLIEHDLKNGYVTGEAAARDYDVRP
jgi:N-methylhydantoinase B